MSTSQALKSRELYTVGWIAALPKELSAAIAMFDEQHDKPLDFEKHASDSNSYHCGRIGNHNVVVACLPHGIYGTTSAATTASSMLFSFPNVKVGLMVGIGAAIPSDANDIRLGDVVVSLPHGRSGGVIQYDLGKNHVETASESDHVLHVFERRGTLNTPPQALLNATGSLEARARIHGHQFPELLQDMLRRHPRMAKSKPRQPGYVYQGQEKDRLFQASYPHISGLGCKDCDPALEISRDAREDPLIPEVHYGVIASGNRLIKDATERDMIARDSGEDSAGLMNSFPCLVIRGICDYADSHKNDEWQEYAAATAAVYAKELLSYLDSADVTKTSRAIEVIEQLSEDVQKMGVSLKGVAKTMDETQANTVYHNVVKWLSAPDPSTNYNVAQEQRRKGTGYWFLQGQLFQEWNRNRHACTWLHGLSGCGKTILSSSIISLLQHEVPPPCPLIYFFFDFRDSTKQSLDGMLRSLIMQLYQQLPHLRHHVEESCEFHKGGTQQPSTDSLKVLYDTMARDAAWVRMVLDAVDEAPKRRDLLDWLESSVGRKEYNLQLIVTSRLEEDIETAFLRCVNPEHHVNIQQNMVDTDIRSYVCHRVLNEQAFKRWQRQPKVQARIVEDLIRKAGGTFRWVVCQLDVLEQCVDYNSLCRALETLPKTLDETYHRMLTAIAEVNFNQATTVLNLLMWSENYQPLSLGAIVDALAVRLDVEPGFDPENRMPYHRDMMRLCSSLVWIDRTGNEDCPAKWTLQLAHFSVKEYLVSSRVLEEFRRPLNEKLAKTHLAKVCLEYLRCLEAGPDISLVLDKYPLLLYSVESWAIMASGAEAADQSLWDLIKSFFNAVDSGFAWVHCYSRGIPPPEALYYACLLGASSIVQALLDHGVNIGVNNQSERRRSALQAASEKGRTEIVRILIYNGDDLDTDDFDGVTALHAASASGHIEIVQMLLERRADLSKRDHLGETALFAASRKGNTEIVQALIAAGADVNAPDKQGRTAIRVAVERGFSDIVQYLHAAGAKLVIGRIST
ncbi:Pfs, NACHT and ankyrin domain protein [Aureobasidium pullulans]|uniref:Pfs, NACHT and ankyrin domain protein n=2 Tax=Aureobasidium pullulans TaxID=5580 RepID=A0A4S9BH02_AURPU|nr:Pfs, NACHT and ankyrin domain protein [Aureobasidium pullulans]